MDQSLDQRTGRTYAEVEAEAKAIGEAAITLLRTASVGHYAVYLGALAALKWVLEPSDEETLRDRLERAAK